MKALVVALLAASATGCGPTISESRFGSFPSKAVDCKIEFVEATSIQNATAPLEQVGSISLAQEGTIDPGNAGYREEVRKRACVMGGDLVAFGGSSTSQANNAVRTTFSSSTFHVFRHRPAQSTALPPAAPNL